MVPADLHDFLIAIITASASFIGLLFVALSFMTDASGKNQKRIATERILAESSYLALLDLFFVSLVGLLPHTSIGIVSIIMGALGTSNSIRLIRTGLKDGVSYGLLALTTVVYMTQIIYGIYIQTHHSHVLNISWLEIIVIFLFSGALGRAWELTGIHND